MILIAGSEVEKYKHFQPGPGRGVVCVWAAVSCSILDHNWAMLVLLHWRVLSIQQTSNDAPHIRQIKTSGLLLDKALLLYGHFSTYTQCSIYVVFGSIQNLGLENRDKIPLFMSIYENNENWMLMPWLAIVCHCMYPSLDTRTEFSPAPDPRCIYYLWELIH